MASNAVGVGQFLGLHQTPSRSKLPCNTYSTSVTTNTISQQTSSQNPNKPLKPKRSKTPLFSIKNSAIAVASGALLYVASKKLSPGGGGGGGGATGGGGGGGGGGDGGGFWKRLMSPAANADEDQSRWDSHGLPADIVLQLKKLNGFKRYKVSEIEFLDNVQSTVVGLEDPFLEVVSLRAGGVYTKAQLQKELQTLGNSGLFEKVNLEAKTNPDGTIKLTGSFKESTWEKAESFKCISAGSMAQSKAADVKAKPCMLPSSVHGEITEILGQGNYVSARMLQNIRDRVYNWYHDEGYACAHSVNVELNNNELVCEMAEGDITRVVIQVEDKLGNVSERNPQIEVVERQLPEQLKSGNVFNTEAGMQALRNISSLSLFSEAEIKPRPDEKNEGGVVVEIKLKERDENSQVGGHYEYSVTS